MITVSKPDKDISATIDLTPSKSITNRALIIRALSENRITLENSSESTDSLVLKNGARKTSQGDKCKRCRHGVPVSYFIPKFAGEYFHPDRFLPGCSKGQSVDLCVHMRAIGAEIDFIGKQNYPPLKIIGKKMKGGTVSLDASESSQYISALLMIAPKLSNGLKIEMTAKLFRGHI
jgi:3-phosphoshikimate 1-carboxyvinyltransferase